MEKSRHPWRKTPPTLPFGTTVTLGHHTHVFDDGRVLVGGSPSRVARLSPAAVEAFTPPPDGEPEHRRRSTSLQVTSPTSQRVAQYLVAAGLADPDPHSLPERDGSDITVVIPCYRRAEPLRRLLTSVRAELSDAPIIVVDDGSDEQGAEIARAAEAFGAQLITLPQNQGPAAARNAGLQRVQTGYVLFVDTDVVLRPGSISLLLRHMADDQLAAIAPRVMGMRRTEQNWVLRYEQARSSLDHGPHACLVRPHSPQSWLSTTCLLARREAVGGGFTAGMRVAEDVDLVWRLNRGGWRVRYEPRAVVEHEHRASVRGWLGRKYVYGTGAALLAAQHGNLVAPAVMSPWAGAVLIAAAAQRRWSAPVAATITIVATGVNMGRLRKTQPQLGGRTLLALRLASFGLSAAFGQGLALVVRHWWPAMVAAGFVSSRARRVIVAAGVMEAAWEYARLKPDLDPLRFGVARRLDDAAYGLGVWSSAVRARSLTALLPARPQRAQESGSASRSGQPPRRSRLRRRARSAEAS